MFQTEIVRREKKGKHLSGPCGFSISWLVKLGLARVRRRKGKEPRVLLESENILFL